MGRFRWHRLRTVLRGTTSTIRVKPIVYEDEYVKVPQYPPIVDTSYLARKQREKETWHEAVKSLDTVEEKLMKINMPRYYGWKSIIIEENKIRYQSLPLAKYITRTELLDFKDLPEKHAINMPDELVNQVKSQVEEALVFEHQYRRQTQQEIKKDGSVEVNSLEDIVQKSVIEHINRILMVNLLDTAPHLLETQIEPDPRVETFWQAGWEDPPPGVVKFLEKFEWRKNIPHGPFNRWIQYFGTPVLHLRHELPLSTVTDISESENESHKVTSFPYDPRVLGFPHDMHRVGTNIPGFWPGDNCEFGLLSYHLKGHMVNRINELEQEDKAEALHVQGILSSFGWLHPQACYQGFSTYNDLTYPLVTQTVITDGKLWSFYVYQLNTTLIHSENGYKNPRVNYCWGTEELKLYEEITDGKVIGFNDEVLKTLLKFYLNAPKKREGVKLKPYLGEEIQHIADITDEKKRDWLENSFKHMYSSRPRHRLIPEVYDWEKIYKIRHQTRPLEARRRPFELNQHPYKRRYDEHVPKYIPKSKREEGKRKQKFEDTYYP